MTTESEGRQTSRLGHDGHYTDRLIRIAGGWHIAHRSVWIDYQSPVPLRPPLHLCGGPAFRG